MKLKYVFIFLIVVGLIGLAVANGLGGTRQNLGACNLDTSSKIPGQVIGVCSLDRCEPVLETDYTVNTKDQTFDAQLTLNCNNTCFAGLGRIKNFSYANKSNVNEAMCVLAQDLFDDRMARQKTETKPTYVNKGRYG